MLAAFGISGFIPLLFTEHEAVKLVCLDVDRWNVADSGIMETGALLANRFNDAQDGFLFQSGQPAGGSYADALTKQPDNIIDLLGFDSQAVQRLRLGKGFVASQAAEAANDTVLVSEIGEVLGFAGTAMAFQLAFLGKES
ncbi:MAG: hypothetical protein ABSC01_05525 [Verrucomicrobiota bacterium]